MRRPDECTTARPQGMRALGQLEGHQVTRARQSAAGSRQAPWRCPAVMSVCVRYVTHYHLTYFLVQMCLAVTLKYLAGYIGENSEPLTAKWLQYSNYNAEEAQDEIHKIGSLPRTHQLQNVGGKGNWPGFIKITGRYNSQWSENSLSCATGRNNTSQFNKRHDFCTRCFPLFMPKYQEEK